MTDPVELCVADLEAALRAHRDEHGTSAADAQLALGRVLARHLVRITPPELLAEALTQALDLVAVETHEARAAAGIRLVPRRPSLPLLTGGRGR